MDTVSVSKSVLLKLIDIYYNRTSANPAIYDKSHPSITFDDSDAYYDFCSYIEVLDVETRRA